MAIFRAGKRVGPFDIRVGFPRDRSYERIDYPANYTRANTDNTIGRFRAMMGRAQGYARPSRFAIRVYLPTNLSKLAGLRTGGTTAPGQEGGAQPLHPNANTLQQLSSQMGQQVLCILLGTTKQQSSRCNR